jgi:hypothetical protein
MNKHAANANVAISAYLAAGNGDINDFEATVVDLVTDLLHWAKGASIDTSLVIQRALDHFGFEREAVL